ncbi:MAG: thrombospondin type 3 repeat-containing protein [Candidatus Poribacteria bacterium]|nr:thrombospondin type 3 repeat-containing protein [Candidatus Poribacteria bacterium]
MTQLFSGFLGAKNRIATIIMAGIASVILVATTAQPSQAQIILDGPNLSGNVGLNGETFGSGSINFSWSGGSVNVSLPSGKTDFLVRVEPDKTIRAGVDMRNFAGGTNASVFFSKINITGPLSSDTEPLNVDLRRDAGGIIGRVTVTGGEVRNVRINVNATIAPNEFVSGSAQATTAPFDAILPFVATAGVNVRGSATLHADAGCDVPVTLSPQIVAVPLGADVIVTWDFDLTGELCQTGNIQGTVTTAGLDGQNSDATFPLDGPQMFAFGPVNRNQITNTMGDYLFSNLPAGRYRVFQRDFFDPPYNRTDWAQTPAFNLGAGETVTVDLDRSMGTLHGAIEPTGAWTLSDASSISTGAQTRNASNAFLASSADFVDMSTGNVDYAVSSGTTRLTRYIAFFSDNDTMRLANGRFNHDFLRAPFPMESVVNEGDRIDLDFFQPETSQALQVFQIADPTVGLTTFRLTGSTRVFNDSNLQIEQGSISISSNARTGTSPENSIGVLVRGIPGTYTMNAFGQGTDGATYAANFTLTLGVPETTPPGTDVENPIEIVDESTGQTTTGSITFGEVTSGGDTTVSASGSGPQAPGNFRVFGGGNQIYFDVQTTAEFDQATICLSYDDTGLNLQQEERLSLQHFTCTDPDTNTGCSWEDITSQGSPDTFLDEICGETDSFSIFALLLPLDDDDDGIPNVDDNCPATPNPDQADTDMDGIGDACEIDSDNDGVDDDDDNCPLDPNLDQLNTDGDDFGNVCDPDDDGDTVDDGFDNCPLHANTSQADFDDDGLGDICDPDADDDGVDNGLDQCAGTEFDVLVSANGCSSGQLLELECPSNGEYRNHGQYLKCIAHEVNRQVDDGLITEQEKGAIVGTAAKSDIGNK